MNNELKDKIEKIYRLVNGGTTEGERAAARKALDRILKSYNLDDSILNDLELREYWFSYTSNNEKLLLVAIVRKMIGDRTGLMSIRPWTKQFRITLKYIDWVTVDSAYAYFRRHMKVQWKKVVKPVLDKCRKAKTKRIRREELDLLFIGKYIIASNLTQEGDLETINVSDMSEKEYRDRMSMSGIEGGAYNKQVVGGLFLEQ